MKTQILAFLSVTCLATLAFAAPNFVTPAMIKRNGLTDEQYKLLWSQGKRPHIDVATARDWIFRASRYTNVVDWLEICGRTNDFAKLSHKLQGENFELDATNKLIVAYNKVLIGELAKAERDSKAAKELDKAARKFGKNLEKVRKDFEKYLRKASTAEEKEFWQALIDIIPTPNEG